eukprot:Blabericola_migrator_1__3295@NODE_1970_length_3487_cov_36_954971_g1254_i0_p1_GENE_NODE_1970_length_3487_cov_36_954971_g1254_i0NODE_1970_length_3487_cov_36_954971_g1254_i0_p1_ORF_typecomplete_len1064_score146_46_NODE_1970_length_3487_cov_36_954971_g1254_i0743265
MLGTRRCILQSHSQYQTSKADMSTIKTVGFSVCCVLGGRRGEVFTDEDVCSNSTPQQLPQRSMEAQSRPPTLQPNDIISRFCTEFLGSLAPQDRPEWLTAVQNTLAKLNFVTPSLPNHLTELLDCATEVHVTLINAGFEPLPSSTPAEVEALLGVHCLISHLNKAVAVSGASCNLSGVVRTKIAALEEYCRNTICYLSSGLDRPWHERLQRLLAHPQMFRRPRLQYVMAKLLKEAEQALQNGCFTNAELATLTHVQKTANDYASLRPYVARLSELRVKHETIKRTLGQSRLIGSRQPAGGSEPLLSVGDCQPSPTLAEMSWSSALKSPRQQPPPLKQKWGREHSSQESSVQSPERVQQSSHSFGGLAQSTGRHLKGKTPNQSSHHVQLPGGSNHSHKDLQRHGFEPLRQMLHQAESVQPLSPITQRFKPEWAAASYGGQHTMPQSQRSNAKPLLALPPNVPATDVKWPGRDTGSQERPYVEQQQSIFPSGSFPTLAQSAAVRQVKEYKRSSQEDSQGGASQSTTPTRPTTDLVMIGTSDGSFGLHFVSRDALHQPRSMPRPLRKPKEHLLNFESALEQEIERAARQNTWQDLKHLDVTESLDKLLEASLKLAHTPPYYCASSLATLKNMLSALLRTRRKIECTPYVRATALQRRNLNQVIWNVSRTWHRLRLIDLNTFSLGQAPLQPCEIQKLTTVEWTAPSFVASQVYGALLEEDGGEAVHDFFGYLISASSPIDLPTAKFCLLILLYLKHENVTLVPQGGNESLDKLIAKLRHKLFNAEVTEISLFDLPEFIEFASKCYGVDRIPQQGWQASLNEKGFWPTKKLSPLVSKLNLHGKAFRLGLEQISASSRVGKYADHINLLNKFYSRLLASPAPNVHEFEATFEQFSYFAETYINECEENGHPASQHQLRVLEVTRNSLQWCRLLFAHLRMTPSDVLRETYDKVSTAWILNSLWCREQTFSLTCTDRAAITKKILLVLESGEIQNELLAWSKAFLDQNVSCELLELIIQKFSLDQAMTLTDDDRILNLLTQECRMNLVAPKDNSHVSLRLFEAVQKLSEQP